MQPYIQTNIGKAKYVVSFYEGKNHEDGSPQEEIRIFSRKKEAQSFLKSIS